MTAVDEIAPDIFRLSVYVPEFDMQFNHFLVRDEEPLLFHTGLRAMFPMLREAVALVAGRVPPEASGGVRLDTIGAIAATGVDYVSVGRLTQSAPAADIGLDFTPI